MRFQPIEHVTRKPGQLAFTPRELILIRHSESNLDLNCPLDMLNKFLRVGTLWTAKFVRDNFGQLFYSLPAI